MFGMHTPLSMRIAGALLLPAALVAFALPARAQEPDEDDAYQGESPERYAQVRLLDGEATIFKGEVQEPLERGTPVAEGDVVESRGRGVLQLGDGSRIAFAPNTRFQVAALFMDRNGDRQVLLRLDYGRIRLVMGGSSEARVRVDTPSGSAVLGDRASASLEVDRDHAVRLRVHSGRVRFSNERDRGTIQAGERLTVYGPQDNLDRVHGFSTYETDAFDTWCERALVIRRGRSWDYVPSEIRYFADDLDENGDWIEVEDVGWCWRPRVTVNEWRPYWRGRWGGYAGGLTWISDEPWGYVTHHHGRWGWHARHGWYWIPGVFYAPAWVAWHHQSDYFGWAPLGYLNYPVSWGYGPWGGGFCWNIINFNFIHVHRIHTHIHHTPQVIRTFTGSTTWTPGRGRDLRRPWLQGPLVLTPGEFRNPGQIARALDRNVLRGRVQAYERGAREATGRTIIRREISDVPRPQEPGVQGPRVPFEDRGARRPAERPILRETPRRSPDEPRVTAPTTPRGTPTRERGMDRPSLDVPPRRDPRPERPVEIAPRGGGETRREPAPERPRDPRFGSWNEPHRDPAPDRPRESRLDEPRPSEPPRTRSRDWDPPRTVSPAPRREEPAPRVERPSSPPPPSKPSAPSPSSRPSADRGGSRRG